MMRDTRTEPSAEGASWVHFALCVGSILVLLALFLVPAVAPALLRAEHWAADWRTAFLSDRLESEHPKVAIIAVTEDSLAGLPYILPVNRAYIADIVTAADQAGAIAIGLDFYFTRDTEKDPDAKLTAALQRAKDKVVLGIFEDPRRRAQLDYQLAFIKRSGARAGYIDLRPEADHVIRYRAHAAARAEYQESFSSVMANVAGWRGDTVPDRIAWLLSPREGSRTFAEMSADKFLTASAEERAGLVKGRAVFIGGKLFSLDQHWTPLSLRSGAMSGVDIHAQIAAELLDATRSYSELDPLQARIFVALLACLGFLLGARFQRRGVDFLDWRFASFAIIALDLVLFRFFHLMLPFTLAAVVWIAGVTAGSQLRSAAAWGRSQWRGGT